MHACANETDNRSTFDYIHVAVRQLTFDPDVPIVARALNKMGCFNFDNLATAVIVQLGSSYSFIFKLLFLWRR